MKPSWKSWRLPSFSNFVSLPAIQLCNEQTIRYVKQAQPDTLAALKACSSLRYLDAGKKLHADTSIRSSGIYVQTALVDMYAKCSCMNEAQEAFDSMPFHDAPSWNALILGYAVNGEEEQALQCFHRMEVSGCSPNNRSYVSGLMACIRLAEKYTGAPVDALRCLENGMKMHSQAIRAGYDTDVFVGNVLVGMYSKCGNLMSARSAFDRMEAHDVVSWTTLLMGYVENGESLLATELFASLISQGFDVTSRMFVPVLTACSLLATEEAPKLVDGTLLKPESLTKGRALHSQAVERRLDTDMFLASTLVDMYSKCGDLSSAHGVFTEMPQRDVVAWTALIQGYADNGEGEEALRLFTSMDCPPNARTFVAALTACSCMASRRENVVETVRAFHSRTAEAGYDTGDTYVGNMLVGAYSKCRELVDAHKVFDNMLRKDVASWTNLILGYVEAEEPETALGLFSRMSLESSGVAPDSRVFLGALMACACLAEREEGTEAGVKLRALERGMEIHSQAVRSRCDTDVFLASALVDMYVKCGSMQDVRASVQRVVNLDLVLWNALMLAYVENGEAELVFELFSCMKRLGCLPDSQTFVPLVTACASLATKEESGGSNSQRMKWLEKGMCIHHEAASSGNAANIFVSNALVDMYGKCGSPVDARRVFDRMIYHDLVSWNSIMSASCETGVEELALELFMCLKTESFGPDARSYVIAMMACGGLVEVESGRQIHGEVNRAGMSSSSVVNSLLEFYGKCGKMCLAQLVFESMETMSISAWNSLIGGYGRQGDARRVLELFETMKEEEVRADRGTFLTALTTCSHAGLVDKGRELFQTMLAQEKLSPNLVHFRGMVDLFGRANLLDDALQLLSKAPLREDVLAWTAFLAACGKWRNLRLGKVAYEKLMELDNTNTGAYSLMANLLRQAESF